MKIKKNRTKIVFIGVGKGGTKLLKILFEDSDIDLIGVANRHQDTEGIKQAKKLGIKTYSDYKKLLARKGINIIIDASGNQEVADYLKNHPKVGAEVLSGLGAKLLWRLVDEREHAENEIKKSLEEQEALYQIGLMLSSMDRSQKALDVIIESAMKLVGMAAGSIALYDEEKGEMEIKAIKGFKKREYMDLGYRWSLRKGGMTNLVLSNKLPTVIGDIRRDKRSDHTMLKKMGVVSLVAMPLITEGRIVGVLYVDDFKSRKFSKRDVGLMGLLGTQAAIALDKLHVLERAKRQAIVDELTKLYNHRFFTSKLAKEFRRASRYNYSLSICMVDVDYFKNYNDNNGHPKGNVVLTKVAKILLTKVRECDVVARFGGEEFAIILPTTDKKAARNLAERARKSVAYHKFDNESQQPDGRLTISVGVASYPEDCQDVEALIECADKALYKAKEKGRNCTCLYQKSENKLPL